MDFDLDDRCCLVLQYDWKQGCVQLRFVPWGRVLALFLCFAASFRGQRGTRRLTARYADHILVDGTGAAVYSGTYRGNPAKQMGAKK